MHSDAIPLPSGDKWRDVKSMRRKTRADFFRMRGCLVLIFALGGAVSCSHGSADGDKVYPSVDWMVVHKKPEFFPSGPPSKQEALGHDAVWFFHKDGRMQAYKISNNRWIHAFRDAQSANVAEMFETLKALSADFAGESVSHGEFAHQTGLTVEHVPATVRISGGSSSRFHDFYSGPVHGLTGAGRAFLESLEKDFSADPMKASSDSWLRAVVLRDITVVRHVDSVDFQGHETFRKLVDTALADPFMLIALEPDVGEALVNFLSERDIYRKAFRSGNITYELRVLKQR